MAKKNVYKVLFLSQGQLYEIYAQEVRPAHLFGFVEVEKLLFGERSAIVVDPSEERLKTEFSGVERTYIPLHAIVRIDEVERRGAAKITEVPKSEKVTPFPGPIYTPTEKK